MTDADFRQLVKEMREAKDRYFKFSRSGSQRQLGDALRESLALERRVDKELSQEGLFS